MKKIFNALLAAACLALPPLQAQENTIGIVFMHGKWGSPDKRIVELVDALKAEGYLVEAPRLPWAGAREYDADMGQAMAEVDKVVAGLRAKGARKILVGGQSMGANAALHYAGRTQVDGVIIVALGHFPEGAKTQDVTRASLRRAKKMVSEGKGQERGSFEDFNTGNRRKTVSCSARNYLSYFDPDGPMNAANNAAKVKPGTPVLWVDPSQEELGPKRQGQAAYERLPESPASKRVEVDAEHMNAPAAAIKEVSAWLKAQR